MFIYNIYGNLEYYILYKRIIKKVIIFNIYTHVRVVNLHFCLGYIRSRNNIFGIHSYLFLPSLANCIIFHMQLRVDVLDDIFCHPSFNFPVLFCWQYIYIIWGHFEEKGMALPARVWSDRSTWGPHLQLDAVKK